MTATAPTYLRPLDAAAEYIARNWSVLPVGADKRPLLPWAEFQKRRATETDLAAWRSKWPDCGLGIVCGEISGLLVVDLDAKDPASFGEAKQLVSSCLPDSLVCPIARTKSNGEHWYFKRPDAGMGNRARIGGLPLDSRCDGGYVVAPPSPGYTWVVSPTDCELPEAPDALLELLARPRPAPPLRVDQDGGAHPGYDWNVERARRYVARIPGGVEGEHGSNPCYRAACALVHEWALTDSDAFDILHEYSQRCSPPWTEKELWHKIEQAKKETRHDRPYGFLRDSTPLVTSHPGEQELGGEPQSVGKPIIILDCNESRVVGEAIGALARQYRYFQRGGSLVRIIQPATPDGEPRSLPKIDFVPLASLEVALSDAAKWVKRKVTYAKDGTEQIKDDDVKPPTWATAGVYSAGQWKGIRPLVAITSTPCLRRDGTIFNEAGTYDPSTGLFFKPVGGVNPIKDNPTYGDALKARDELLEVVSDFPFASELYRAAWLSLALTPFARHTLTDSAPLGYIDANTRGSGKSLLASATALIATGRRVPMSSWPEDEAEQEKRITTLLIEGASLVIFDNCEHVIGGQPLNIVLTGSSWTGRILGRSQSTGEIPLRTTFMATGNNCDFAADTTRRTIHVRLVSPLERPEQRTDFSHKYLLEWVGENRPRLAAAALTILRAYHVAGCPELGLPAMGAFTDWHRFVRSPVVWLGMEDPSKTQEQLAATSDRGTAELAALIDGIREAQLGSTEWHTAQQLLALAGTPTGQHLADALLEHAPARGGGLPTPRTLGVLLRRHVDRVYGGLVIKRSVTCSTSLWRVKEAK